MQNTEEKKLENGIKDRQYAHDFFLRFILNLFYIRFPSIYEFEIELLLSEKVNCASPKKKSKKKN